MAESEKVEGVLPTFKRRKVMRKPNLEDDPNEITGTIVKRDQEHEENGNATVTRVNRRGGVKKLGIGFSSAEGGRNMRDKASEEQTLVVAGDDDIAELPQNDRFVKPTGRVGVVTEDKHMMAYVDSKLAEMRPAAASASPTPYTNDNGTSASPRSREDSEPTETTQTAGTGMMPARIAPGSTTYQIAQERSRRVYQRPTRKKPRPSRPETDVARDSMIEQIMGENQVPHYDKTAPQSHVDKINASGDNDAAAEEAFKAQMLADLERNAKRRPPRIQQATASTGPKLGGSRAQREKMRALEEAKGSGAGSGSKK